MVERRISLFWIVPAPEGAKTVVACEIGQRQAERGDFPGIPLPGDFELAFEGVARP